MSDEPNSSLLSAMSLRIRFSLRTLLVVTTVLSLWFAYFFGRVQNERRAAEAITAASGAVVYDWQIRPEGSDPNVKPKRPGPEWLRNYLGPHWFDQIVQVRLNEFGNPGPNNSFLKVGPHLAKLPALRSLLLWGGDLDVVDCVLIGRLTQLEELHLKPESVIESQHTAAIARAWGLKKFNLGYAKISATALSELSVIPNLTEIHITCDSYDRQTGNFLTEHFLSDQETQVLATFPNLRSVMLFHTRITDEGVKELCKLSQLKTLVVSSPHITSGSFEHVSKLQHLEHLGTWGWEISDSDFDKLSQMPSLSSLGLLASLTDESVPHLLQFKGLEKLTLSGQEVTEESVQHLCKMRNLTWLNLRSTSIPKESEAAALLQKSLPNCRIALPKTEKEKEMERIFNMQRFSGF